MTFLKIPKKNKIKSTIIKYIIIYFIVVYFITINMDPIECIKFGKSTQQIIRPHFYHLIKLLDDNDIEYFADWGTLLGAVRHGEEIPWDDDYDIYMQEHNIDKLESLSNIVVDNNLFKMPDRKIKYVSLQKYSVGKINAFYYVFIESKFHFYQIFAFDVNFKYISRITDIFYTKRDTYTKPNSDGLYPIIKMKFGETQINIMNNYIEYLNKIYGPNYLTEFYVGNHKIASTFDGKNINKFLKLNVDEYQKLINDYKKIDN
jgi:phosphorylcholine metabolism protein LicD